jgi:hypothetical protein
VCVVVRGSRTLVLLTVAALVFADTNSWSGILVAALGSSALGAIFGGYLTTRVRGRQEREEAWRSRLIDAADEFAQVLVHVLRTLGTVLPEISRGERQLRGASGSPTRETVAVISSARRFLDDAELRLGHLELLVGTDSDVYEHGFRSMHLVEQSVNLMQERQPVQQLIAAVLVERANPGEGIGLLADFPRAVPDFELLRRWENLPDGFDVSDDTNLAQWARALQNVSGEEAHAYMRAARTYIEQYRSG